MVSPFRICSINSLIIQDFTHEETKPMKSMKSCLENNSGRFFIPKKGDYEEMYRLYEHTILSSLSIFIETKFCSLQRAFLTSEIIVIPTIIANRRFS